MVGSSLSHYRIVEELGRGGMGIVYKAEDTNLNRFVAIKVLPTRVNPLGAEAARVRHEAHAAAALNHPNIATIHDLGQSEDGQTFIVMEYVRGETLAARIARSRLEEDEVVIIGLDVAEGLGAAHEAGIVHRDIKPGNLILTERSSTKILDFGLATFAESSYSGSGKRRGTVRYMSPEQARGEQADARSDIWSVGTVLYEMLTGIRPFDAPHDTAILYSIINADPVPPHEHNAAVSAPLEAIVLRCLEKDPENRFQSASDLQAALREVEDTAGVGIQKWRARSGTGRGRWKPIALASVAIILFALTGTSLRNAIFPSLRPPPDVRGLAVLPFVNVGSNVADVPLVDGLVHTVAAQIQGMERFRNSLWVVPSSDVFSSEVETANEAASAWHVQMAVSGSVWVQEDDVQLTLYLVDARSGRTLNSVVLTEDRDDLAALQAGVVNRLADMLEIELRPDDRSQLTAGATSAPGAYEFYIRAQGYLARWDIPENVDLAIAQFKRTIAADPDYVLAVAGLGEAYWRKYENTRDAVWVDSAVAQSRMAIQMDDGVAPVHATLGMIYQGTGRYELAEGQFSRALELDAEHAPAWLGLGAALNLLGRDEEAEDAYKSAVAVSPGNWNTYNKLGIYYHIKGNHNLAAEQFSRVIELAPDNAFGYNNLAVQYQRLGDPVMAESTYVRATRVSSGAVAARARAFYNLGGILYARENFAGAVRMYGKSLELDDTYLQAWSDLGDASHWLGRKDEARAAWHRALALARNELAVNPSDASSLGVNAETYAKLDDRDRALESVNRLLALDHISSSTLRTLAKVHEILGDRAKALEYVNDALEAGHSTAAMEASKWLQDLRADPEYEAIRLLHAASL